MTRALSLVLALCMGVVGLALANGPGAKPSTRAPHFHVAGDARPTLNKAPSRVVSLAPVATETLFALGYGERVVGVTRYCDRPKAAEALPKVGGFVDPQLERILALKPDLVVAMPSMGQRAVLDALVERGIPVLVGFADTVDEVRGFLDGLGAQLGKRDVASRLVADLDRALTDAATLGPKHRPRVAVVVAVQPLVVAGPGTFPDDALRASGAVTAAPEGSGPWPTWSVESLVAARPDVVVVAGGKAAAAELRSRLAPLGAAAPKVVSESDAFLMRPGPYLGDDVKRLARLLAGASR